MTFPFISSTNLFSKRAIKVSSHLQFDIFLLHLGISLVFPWQPTRKCANSVLNQDGVMSQSCPLPCNAHMACSPCSGCISSHNLSVQRIKSFIGDEGASPLRTPGTHLCPWHSEKQSVLGENRKRPPPHCQKAS